MKKVLFIMLTLLLFSCATSKQSSCETKEKKECCGKPTDKK